MLQASPSAWIRELRHRGKHSCPLRPHVATHNYAQQRLGLLLPRGDPLPFVPLHSPPKQKYLTRLVYTVDDVCCSSQHPGGDLLFPSQFVDFLSLRYDARPPVHELEQCSRESVSSVLHFLTSPYVQRRRHHGIRKAYGFTVFCSIKTVGGVLILGVLALPSGTALSKVSWENLQNQGVQSGLSRNTVRAR